MSVGRWKNARNAKYNRQRHNLNPIGVLAMADYRDIYRTPLLSAKNLGKRVITDTISMVYPETVTGEDKQSKDRIIIELTNDDIRISLNKTNAVVLATAFGTDYDEWVGRKVKVSTHKVDMKGSKVDGLLITAIKK
jgi:hypothetical protein